MSDDAEFPNLDFFLWEIVDRSLADLAAIGVEVDDRVASAVAVAVGRKLTTRMASIGREWILAQRVVESASAAVPE
jgi:hypothetical protein